MINFIVHWLKCNTFIRSFVQTFLEHYETRRPYRHIDAWLHFLAGRHLNNFFSRYAEQEPVITGNMVKLIKIDSTIFDIGANIGYYTVMFSKLAPQGIIISVEPDGDNFYWLKKNISMNNLRNVTVINKALSSNECEVDFYIDKNTGRTSSLTREVFHPGGRYGLEKTIVRTVTCDSLAEEKMPDLIKCDIEGHEIAFLHGAVQTLKHHPIIMMEVKKENRADVLKILTDAGYNIFNAEQVLTEKSKPILHIESENILALPAGYDLTKLC